jgi:alkylation response protein AidB-like acyl-CoA dehydrogenase
MAATRKPLRAEQLLCDLPRAQAALARSEAAISAARGYLHSSVLETWRTLVEGRALSDEQTVRLALAAAYTVATCADVVETMYRLGGGAAIYARNPLDRCFRDINTLMADQSAAPWIYEVAGSVYFGRELPVGVL